MDCMTNNYDPNQKRGGAANAGNWTKYENSDPEAPLAEFEPLPRAWGDAGVHEGSRTPWGKADNVSYDAPGITTVDTDSHGGTKLSPERNKLIPAALRNSNRWYEEDCESAIVGMYFPEAYPNWTQEKFEETVKNWFPDRWEKATGQRLQPGESHERDRAVWRSAHAGDFIVTSAQYDETNKTMTRVSARRASDGVEREFLVPRDEYADRQGGTEVGRDGAFIVDPDRHRQLPPKPAPVLTPATQFHDVAHGPTPAAREKIARDLNRRWRDEDGSVKTLAQILEKDGVAGKSAWLDGGRRKYYLTQKTHLEDNASILTVSKATWDAVGAPDERTAEQTAYQDRSIITFKLDNPSPSTDLAKVRQQLRAFDAAAAPK